MDDIGASWVYPSWEEEGAKQKSCPQVDQGSMGRDTPSMVIKSFKTCGISNALDGTEDDVVYSEEIPEVDDEDIEENEFETDSENETDGE